MKAHKVGRLVAKAWVAFAAAAALWTGGVAHAQCTTDADCGDGYVCKTYTGEECAKPDCPPDDKTCASQPSDCAPTEYTTCEPAPCSTDDDCPDSMVCHEWMSSTCTGSAPASEPCMANTDCPTPDAAPPDCTDTTVKQCTPRYALPCETSADCGPGFDCKEEVIGSCSGGSGTAQPGMISGGSGSGPVDAGVALDGGSAQPPPSEVDAAAQEPTCTEMPAGTFSCVVQVLPCSADDECPADFTCEDNPNRAVCNAAGKAEAPSSGGGTAGAGATPVDAGPAGDAGSVDPCGSINDGLPDKVCWPRNYYAGGAGRDVSQGSNNASGGSSETGGGADTGAQVPETPSDSTSGHSADAGDGSGSKHGSGGCAVGAAGQRPADALGLLALLGLCVLELRRRARRAR